MSNTNKSKIDENAYRTELDQVYFTATGRQALIDALMNPENGINSANPKDQQDQKEGKNMDMEVSKKQAHTPVSNRKIWKRVGIAAGLAAVLLVGTALAAAGPLWENYFGHLDENQQNMIDSLSQTLPAVESNGTVMTPLAAFGDPDFYYLMLEIQAPENITLPNYTEDEGYYQLFGDQLGEDITLTDANGQELYNYPEFEWIKRSGESNKLTAVIRLWPQEGVDFSDGTDKILHIPGLWVQDPDKNYTQILSGSWDFNIGANHGNIKILTLDTSGITIEHEECGTLIPDFLRISPLGMRWRYHWTHPVEGIMPGVELAVIMDDGTEIPLVNSMGSSDENWDESYGPFQSPVDLEKAIAVRWGTVEIPLNQAESNEN